MTKFTKAPLGLYSACVWNCNSNSNDNDHIRIPHTLPSYCFEYDGIPLIICRPLNDRNEYYATHGWVISEPNTGRLLINRNYGTMELTVAALKREYSNTVKLADIIVQQTKLDIELGV